MGTARWPMTRMMTAMTPRARATCWDLRATLAALMKTQRDNLGVDEVSAHVSRSLWRRGPRTYADQLNDDWAPATARRHRIRPR